MLFSSVSVSRRIMLVLFLGIATPAIVAINSLVDIRSSLLEARRSEVRHLDEVAWASVDSSYDRFTKGLLTEDQAKEEAIRTVRGMRYDGGNYFFIWDLAGTGIAHGGNPGLEGRNFIDGPDARSKPGVADMVQKLVSVARENGEGFAKYHIPKAGESNPLAKIGYSKLFAPWGWAIGTGAYVTDIDAIFWSKAQSSLVIAISLTLAAGFLSYLLGRDLSGALKRLTTAMQQLASGDLTTTTICVKRRDEIGVMARAVQIFKDHAIRARQLETEKAAQQQLITETSTSVVSRIGRGLEQLAAGDVSIRLSERLPPAYEKLRADFNAAANQLHGLVDGIATATTEIKSGSGEMAGAAENLSRRTEQQATSLESAAAALDAITTTMRNAADGCDEARRLVIGAREDAESSASVVGGAIEAVASIETSFAQVSRITGVIDDIAFQTSLLALNAAVEAAQSSDGCGFTVVAAEVRALAQRSSEAAKEIKTHIDASRRHVSQGVKLVGETGKVLNRIVGQVGQISETIADIASSAQVQSGRLQDVNAAVRQMDLATQQNASLVDRSTVATRQLMQKAEVLADLISRFDIAGGFASRPVSRAA